MNKRNAETFKNNDLLIKSSFLKLLLDKDFPKITVDMICSEANINRSTFYFHFSDKYMLCDMLTRPIEAGASCSREAALSDITGYPRVPRGSDNL